MENNKIRGGVKLHERGFEAASNLVMQEFYDRHPSDSLPNWFSDCATFGGTQNSEKAWVLGFTAVPRQELQLNEFWEERNGKSVLVRIDPKTGQKRIVIHRSVKEVVILFQAIVEPEKSKVTVLIDNDFTVIDGAQFESGESDSNRT